MTCSEVEQTITILTNLAFPHIITCPSCREELTIKLYRHINLTDRVMGVFKLYRQRMVFNFRYRVRQKRARMVSLLGALTLSFPMLLAIEHSMGIFQGRRGPRGKLPYLQIAVIGLTDLVLTGAWIQTIPMSPFAYLRYRLYIILLDVPWVRATAMWFLYWYGAAHNAFLDW
jgi:hypothetical protein